MNHKMISLCDETFDRAKRFDNFSRWVRLAILNQIENEQLEVWFRCKYCTDMTEAVERVLVREKYFRDSNVYCSACSLERGYRVWMVKA